MQLAFYCERRYLLLPLWIELKKIFKASIFMAQESSVTMTVAQLYFLEIIILFHFKRRLALAELLSFRTSTVVSSTC